MSTLKARLMASPAVEFKAVPEITTPGDDFERRIAKATATERALWARDLVTGHVTIYPHSRRQALALAQPSGGYFATALRLTDCEAGRVRRGFASLADFHRSMTDGDVIRTVAEIGSDRVLRALDVLTAPKSVAA